MKRAFISRLGGAGDVLHASHLPRLIKEHFGVDHIAFETNECGMHILLNNSYIDDLQYVDVSKMTHNRMVKNLEWAREKYDMVFDLANTIEKAYCTNENDGRYYRSQKWRREKLGQKSYYDVMVDAVGLPESCYGERGRLYYTYDQELAAEAWRTQNLAKASHLIIVNLSGSTLHKKFVQAEDVSRRILAKYPKAVIYLTGDEHCKEQVFEGDRIVSWVGKKSFRTVALLTRYADLTISMESGLPLIAHSWDAPCLQLLTAASPQNHIAGARRAYWLQSPVACSPCHRNPREYFGCPVREKMPECVYFSVDEVMSKVEEAIGNR